MSASGTASIGYDARGNVSSIGGAGYGYNSRNRLNRFAGGYIYNTPLDELFDVSTEQRQLMRSGGEVLTELGYDGQTKRRYVWGPGTDEPLVWYEGAGTGDRRYLHADERGSIVAVSNDAGNAIAINTYDEYGMPGAGNIGRFQYTGQKWLPELGLYDYKARMYSPKLGRFMQTDPIGYGDGLNLYGYVGGDPVNFRDPLGLAGTEDPKPDPAGDIVVTGSRIKQQNAIVSDGLLILSVISFSGSGSGILNAIDLTMTDEAPDTLQNGEGEDIVVTARRRAITPPSRTEMDRFINYYLGGCTLDDWAAITGSTPPEKLRTSQGEPGKEERLLKARQDAKRIADRKPPVRAGWKGSAYLFLELISKIFK